LLGISGSVAAIKGPELAIQLTKELDAHVVILLTRGGENFWCKAQEYNPKIWEECNSMMREEDNTLIMRETKEDATGSSTQTPSLPEPPINDESRRMMLFTAQDEWKGWQRMSDPVLHIQLRDWADIAVIAPLTAHTLAKISKGLCDDTLTCIIRAWDYGHTSKDGKHLVLAPAMNTGMWDHPLTRIQLNAIKGFCNNKRGECLVKIVEPQIKTLACGEVGNGAMASVVDIVEVSRQSLQK